MRKSERIHRIALLCCLLALAALTSRPAGAGPNRWTSNGPRQNGVRVHALAMRPDNADVLWAATNKGLYKSINAGESWVTKSTGLTGYGGLVVDDVAISSAHPSLMYAGTWGSGVYKSTDGGESWRQSNTGLPGRSAPPVAAQGAQAGPEIPKLRGSPDLASSATGADLAASAMGIAWTPVRRLAVNPYNDQYVYAAISNFGVYRTTNGGDNWGASLTDGGAYAVVIDPRSSNVVYASIAGQGIYKSGNHGDSWVRLTSELTTTLGLAVDPQSSSTLYAAVYGRGIFKSTNGGASWEPRNNGLGTDLALRCVSVSPSSPNVVYAGSDWWLYRSQDGGASWQITDQAFPSYYLDDILVHPTLPAMVYVASDQLGGGGVFKSTEGGAQLTVKNNGLLRTIVYALEADPSNAQNVYAGTWGGGVFKSADGGGTWSASNGEAPDSLWLPYVYDIVVAAEKPHVVYVGTAYDDEGVFKSTDSGTSWKEMSTGLPGDDRDVFALAVDPGSSDRVYAGTENNVFRSENGAGNWLATTGVPDGTQVLALAVDPFARNVVYAGTYGKGVYRSTDYGATWNAVNSGLGNLYVYEVLPDALVAQRIYAATANRVYRSDNRGGSWALASSGLPVVAVRAMDVVPSGMVFAGTHNQGVYRGAAGGASWSPMNAGLGSLEVRAMLAVESSPITVHAGTEGESAWEFTMGGASRQLLPIVLKRYRVGSAPTPTTGATRTPTRTPVATATTQPIYFDGFSNPASGWSTYEDGNVRYAYTGGEYQILLKNVNWYGATSSGYRCTDCAVEVQGRVLGSAPGWLGIMFGITDGWGGYLFRINESGQYSLRVKLESEWGDYLVPWTSSPQINPPPNWNRLRVVRRGSSIELYINGQYLAAANHSRFAGNLRVGLTASSRDQVPVDVRFDNFAVYAASGGMPVRGQQAPGAGAQDQAEDGRP